MIEPELIARFTTHLKEALQKALVFTIQSGREIVEPGDLFVGLLLEKGSIAYELLSKAQADREVAEKMFCGTAVTRSAGAAVTPNLSEGVKKILEKCILTAHLLEHRFVGTEHLLFAILDLSFPEIRQYCELGKIDVEVLKVYLAKILRTSSRSPDDMLHEEDRVSDEPVAVSQSFSQSRSIKDTKHTRAMEVFTRELTSSDMVAQLDPVIGRESEMIRMMEILCRRVKNNPILLGEPGVGKTALVEGLAQRLFTGDVPDLLLGKRILAVDLALMVAGTMYRGEFEARLKQLVEEVKQEKNIILFIDEIHNVVGAGSTTGSLDAANILKPSLARGEIRCVGATTWAEYKKFIEPDAALERRYQLVDVSEPTVEQTLAMLQGIKHRYEEHHGVKFEKSTLEYAVLLAERYLTERFFPDKAIDVLDEAAASASVRRHRSEGVERLRSVEVALHMLKEYREKAVRAGLLQEASKMLEQERRMLQEREAIESAMQRSRSAHRLFVTKDHIAEVVARAARVPLSVVRMEEVHLMKHIEEQLRKQIVGQDQAISVIAQVVQHAQCGLHDPQRPKASLLFVGPSGVGKTALARALAVALFGKDEALVKLDMTEFAESHAVSKLLGSPAGYVGYREHNRLADAVRKKPHAVLLFDEFEKAHPDVQHLLLQLLEDGKLTDSTGRPILFRQNFIILTSNVGADLLHRTVLGFSGMSSMSDAYERLVQEQIKERFRPELLNRLDRVVVFQPLAHASLKEIMRIELDKVFGRLAEARKIAYSAGDEVLDWLLHGTPQAEEGARAVRRIVEQEVSQLIAKTILAHPQKKKGQMRVTKEGLKIV